MTHRVGRHREGGIVTAGTIAVQISARLEGYTRQLREVQSTLDQFFALLRYGQQRQWAERLHDLGRAAQILMPDAGWDVQRVTTSEGCCRVVVRRLGGWS